MGKKRSNKQQKTARKKHHHTHDASLPSIEVSPNIANEPIPYLPKIIVDCDTKISRRNIKKVQRYLQFSDPHDLRHLSSIRIVEPSAITLPSKATTDGCYWPKWENQTPEIWLSTRLLTFPGLKWACLNLFILRKDRLFETIFHELGHHKAHSIRLVSQYKQEAYAEKYMLEYKRVWQQHRWWPRAIRKSCDSVLMFLANRYIMLAIYFFMRKKNPVIRQMYDLYKKFALRRLSREEFEQQADTLMGELTRTRKAHRASQKWTHPLRKSEYRRKFGLDD